MLNSCRPRCRPEHTQFATRTISSLSRSLERGLFSFFVSILLRNRSWQRLCPCRNSSALRHSRHVNIFRIAISSIIHIIITHHAYSIVLTSRFPNNYGIFDSDAEIEAEPAALKELTLLSSLSLVCHRKLECTLNVLIVMSVTTIDILCNRSL